jgi:HD-GYP domain-containing protein (c-di-GMP phosphodiesterase class II)
MRFGFLAPCYSPFRKGSADGGKHMSQSRISLTDIQMGGPLLWDVYDKNGLLLLKRGYIIERLSQIEALVARGLYADVSTTFSRGQNNGVAQSQEMPSALRLINLSIKRLERLVADLLNNQPGFPEKLLEVAKTMIYAIELNPDVAIACILLNQQTAVYSGRHCVDTALVSLMIAQSINIPAEEKISLSAAALTMNVGMAHLHAQLNSKQGKLSDGEVAQIRRHPEESLRMLKAAGVKDANWLAYVLAHHEAEDGSGYPFGKAGADIPRNAKIITLADRYCACVSSRDYRKPLLPNVALRDIFLASGKGMDSTFAAHFIKVLGIYPPGTLVRLNSGEIGVVSKKGRSADTPVVHALVGPRGAPLVIPLKRNTAIEIYAIKEALSDVQANIHFSMHQVWGNEARL